MSAWTTDPILQVIGLISNELFWKHVHANRFYKTTFHSLYLQIKSLLTQATKNPVRVQQLPWKAHGRDSRLPVPARGRSLTCPLAWEIQVWRSKSSRLLWYFLVVFTAIKMSFSSRLSLAELLAAPRRPLRASCGLPARPPPAGAPAEPPGPARSGGGALGPAASGGRGTAGRCPRGSSNSSRAAAPRDSSTPALRSPRQGPLMLQPRGPPPQGAAASWPRTLGGGDGPAEGAPGGRRAAAAAAGLSGAAAPLRASPVGRGLAATRGPGTEAEAQRERRAAGSSGVRGGCRCPSRSLTCRYGRAVSRRAPPRPASLPRGLWGLSPAAASGGAVRPSPWAPREGSGSRLALGPRSPFRRACLCRSRCRSRGATLSRASSGSRGVPRRCGGPVFDCRVVRAVGRAEVVAEGTVR